MRPREIAVNACIFATITVALLVAAEVGSYLIIRLHRSVIAQVAEAAKTSDSMRFIYRDQEWADTYWREDKAANRVAYQPYVEWQMLPYKGKTIVIDNDHMRRTFYSHCDGNAHTIWMFGGSTMWGLGSPDWDTIPSFLAKEYERAGRAVCVRNYGQTAWANSQEVIELVQQLKHTSRKPDVVIFYDGINDVLVTYHNGIAGVPINFRTTARQLEGSGTRNPRSFGYVFETYTAELLRGVSLRFPSNRRNSALATRAPAAEIDRMARETIASYVENIKLVRRLSQAYKFNYAFFWQPLLSAELKPLTPEEEEIRRLWDRQNPGLEPLYQRTYALIRVEHPSDVAYIADVFQTQRENLYIDLLHVGPEGNRLVAARMHEILLQKEGPAR